MLTERVSMTRSDTDSWDLASSVGATATMVAAARALAGVVSPAELGPHYIIPSVFHPDVASAVAAAVRDAAGGRDR